MMRRWSLLVALLGILAHVFRRPTRVEPLAVLMAVWMAIWPAVWRSIKLHGLTFPLSPRSHSLQKVLRFCWEGEAAPTPPGNLWV